MYNDLRCLGGLKPAIEDALRSIGSPLAASVRLVSSPTLVLSLQTVSAATDQRECVIWLAKLLYPVEGEWLLAVRFCEGETESGYGFTHLSFEIAQAVHAWLADLADTAQMREPFQFFASNLVVPRPESSDEIEARWHWLLYGLSEEQMMAPILLAKCDAELRLLRSKLAALPGDSALQDHLQLHLSEVLKVRDKTRQWESANLRIPLRSFLKLAYEVPQIRRLKPGVSISGLSFSRTASTRDIVPVLIVPVSEGRYDVKVNEACVLAGGTPSEALQAVLRYFPSV